MVGGVPCVADQMSIDVGFWDFLSIGTMRRTGPVNETQDWLSLTAQCTPAPANHRDRSSPKYRVFGMVSAQPLEPSPCPKNTTDRRAKPQRCERARPNETSIPTHQLQHARQSWRLPRYLRVRRLRRMMLQRLIKVPTLENLIGARTVIRKRSAEKPSALLTVPSGIEPGGSHAECALCPVLQ